ncbi:hypothetical protein KN63_07065 [Smithella sp. F21]|jgi:hypothetical protein|nr:hypothetical protein KN63_07065 [Smithella sp. F21]
MYMMFVDESGDPGYPADGNWSRWGGSTHFARVGLIIHGWKWKAWNDRLMSFKRNRGLTWDVEIKASDIRRGKGGFVGWDYARRQFFLQNLMELVGLNPDITLLGVVIDKRNVDTTQGSRRVKPEVCSLELLLERYNYFLHNQKDKSGIVILDPTKEASDDNIRYFQSFLLAQSPKLQPLHIVEGTFFAKSHTSNLIQVADVCTNVFYREIVRGQKSPEFKSINPRFWRHNGRLKGCGIKEWP